MLAAAAAYYTFAHLLPPDRVVVHFIDSQVAFAWVAKGYASQLHVADIVNKLHLDHMHMGVGGDVSWLPCVYDRYSNAPEPVFSETTLSSPIAMAVFHGFSF